MAYKEEVIFRIPLPSTLNPTGIPYAGIGSRETPYIEGNDIKSMMIACGYYLALQGYVLRSGGAGGADEFFELGADLALKQGKGEKQIFLPWSYFRENPSKWYMGNKGLLKEADNKESYHIASKFHPSWFTIKKQAVKDLMARNVMQAIGPDLNSPSKFVICWTPDGCIHHRDRTFETGGTGQAISIATHYKIPVYNLARPEHKARIEKALIGWEKTYGPVPDLNTLVYKSESDLQKQQQSANKRRFK